MPRTYSFDHFQAKKPQQSVFGSPERLGNPEDKMRPIKHELPERGSELPGAGEIHYGMEHAETVKRFQARLAAKKKTEATPQRTARKAAPRKATAPKQTQAKKTASAKKGTPPARAAATQAPARESTSSRPGLLTWPIRKVASGVKRLASKAVAPKRGRAKNKSPTKR